MEFIIGTQLDETETSYRHRLRNPGDFIEGSFRTITLKGTSGVKMVVGKLKGGDGSMVGQTIIFSKPTWTKEKVLAWLARQGKRKFDMTEEIMEMEEACEATPSIEVEIEAEAPAEVEASAEAEAPVEEVEMSESKEEAETPEFKFTQADIDAAVAGERARISAIFAADAPIELTREAIEVGMDEGEAYKFFWQSEKGMKAEALKEMESEAQVVETEKVEAETLQMSSELSYMDLIAKAKEEQKCSLVEATQFVMREYPEAYKKFVGRD